MSILPEPGPVPVTEKDPLGLGMVVAGQSRRRFVNRDGSFNVRREGLGFFESLSPYHFVLSMSWRWFLFYFTLAFLVTNALFAFAFVVCGPNTLNGSTATTYGGRWLEAFFFSVETFCTIGYGNFSPKSLAANVLVTLEALSGVLGIALATGIIFARFSRPTAEIIFSRNAVIAPYRGITGFMFRIANRRSSQLVELAAQVILSRWKLGSGGKDREFLPLQLERDRVSVFPLTWTVVHPITEASPLYGLSREDMERSDPEFLILLNGFDETFSQTVHTRSSYKLSELVFDAKFKSLYTAMGDDDLIRVNVRDIHEVERVRAG